MIDPGDLQYLARQLEQGRVILFTGAGFQAGARDLTGRELPLGPQVADELWQLCFPGEPRDPESSLQDLFDLALTRNRGALADYMATRFSVDASSIPNHLCAWFSAPWRRIYTLNVDDLELAAARRFQLPRPLKSLSALPLHSDLHDPMAVSNSLEVIHLNGVARSGPDGVTFSTSQYARRIGGSDAFYPQLVSELVGLPCIFVGTQLNESPLWQHIELRGEKGKLNQELRPKSFLVTPFLSRAKEKLLRQYNVHWIPATAEGFAASVLQTLDEQIERGLAWLARPQATGEGGQVQRIPLVSEIAAPKALPKEASYYLLGDEPTWSDIVAARAIERESDAGILKAAIAILAPPRRAGEAGTLLLLSGTAGSGTSTAMMRLALSLTARGEEVGWVGASAEISPRRLELFPADLTSRVLFIDSAERYGYELASVIKPLLGGKLRLLVLGMRASQVERLMSGPRVEDIKRAEISIPLLADSDIDALLAVLTTHSLLGRLRGLSRLEQVAAFREKADRQLIVAMIEATSGRKFEEKIFEEWDDLTPHEKEAYGLVALAHSFSYTVDREQLLVASGDAGNEVLNALEGLIRRHTLRETADGQIRSRHRLIAEKLIDEILVQQKELLLHLYSRIAFASAVRIKPTDRRSRPWRFLKVILNHERLYRQFDYLGACALYDEVASVLSWDYHYYLQRGSLELEYGQVRLAENFLEQARALEDHDPRVATAYAYMLLKKALSHSDPHQAHELANRGIDVLLDQIKLRGTVDPYPYHVLGSQGLAWSRRGRFSEAERVALDRLLLEQIKDGVKNHPMEKDLRQLLGDLKKEDLARVIRNR